MLSGAITPRGSVSRWNAWQKGDNCAPTGITDSGGPWTRCVTRRTSKSCGQTARRPGKSGDGSGFLERKTGTDYGPYRVQGRMVVPVAAILGRACRRVFTQGTNGAKFF